MSDSRKTLDPVQAGSIIVGETGVREKKGPGFCFPSPFARKNLYHIIWADEYECDAGYHVRRDYLECFLILYLTKGEFLVRYRGHDYHLKENSVVFLDLREPHYYAAKTNVTVQQYMMDGGAAKAYFNLLYSQNGPCFPGNPKLSYLFRSLKGELSAILPNFHNISLLLDNILTALAAPDYGTMSEGTRLALSYITEHFTEESIQVDDLARAAGLNKYYFTRLFRKETGFTPWEYLLSVRMRRAMFLLSRNLGSVEQISVECGFSSASYFVRAFKKETGMTPNRFRKVFLGAPMESGT